MPRACRGKQLKMEELSWHRSRWALRMRCGRPQISSAAGWTPAITNMWSLDSCFGVCARSVSVWRVQCWGEWLPRLWGDEVVEVVGPDGTLQGVEDARGVVMGALDEQGFAVASEADRAGTGPWAEVAGGLVEARGGLEAEAARVLHRAEHQVLRQVQWGCQGWCLVGGEVGAGELDRAALVHAARADGVFDAQAPDVDQPAADAHLAVARLARDQHAHQARRAGVGDVDVGPVPVAVDGEPLAPPWAHPALDELTLGGAGVVLGGDGADEGSHGRGGHAQGAGDRFGRAASCA